MESYTGEMRYLEKFDQGYQIKTNNNFSILVFDLVNIWIQMKTQLI